MSTPTVQADSDFPEWDVRWSVSVSAPAPDGDPASEIKASWDEFRRRAIAQHFTEESLSEGTEQVYSTSKVAQFFGRSSQWVYWGLRPGPNGEQVFTYRDGTSIRPERVGKGGRRRFTLPIIREIALSCYRRGQINEEELQAIMAKILLAEFGPQAFADTGS